MRPSFTQIYMDLAVSLSMRSTCKRLSVGCVITSSDFRKVLSVGYNGSVSGLDNTCDSDEPGNCGCLHAEFNAIINCDSPRNSDKFVFVTVLPCVTCCKAIANLGNVKKVFYKQEYRIQKSKSIFEAVGIELIQM